MTADKIFSIASALAPLGWLLLIFAPRWKWTRRISALVIPLVFALLYVVILAGHWGQGGGSFGSLDGVAKLFGNRWVLLAGWIHYLAFDLFTGSWEVRDAQERGLPHWLVIPCLVLTFLFGPAGLLLYFTLRALRDKKPVGERATAAAKAL
jgi:hypothetical protein